MGEPEYGNIWDDNEYFAALQAVDISAELNGHKPLTAVQAGWLIDAADLLERPDPGPTPWLVQDLIVDESLTAVAGRWKTTKSWAMLEIAISICTGTQAFGACDIPEPGRVVYVIEESGEKALQRRLDALCRGRGIYPDQLRGKLLLAPNQRVKLDHPDWQERLIDLGQSKAMRAFIFDPLARMKEAERDENTQSGMAPLIEYLRVLRDETRSAPLFVHHTGHQGEHMRGSSDLESAWESKLTFSRDGDNGIVTIKAAHREEEDGGLVTYRLAFDGDTRTMRLRPTVPPLAERILDYLKTHGGSSIETVSKGIGTRRSDTSRALLQMEALGTAHRAPSDKRDAMGRPIAAKVWHPSKQAVLHTVPETGRNGTGYENE